MPGGLGASSDHALAASNGPASEFGFTFCSFRAFAAANRLQPEGRRCKDAVYGVLWKENIAEVVSRQEQKTLMATLEHQDGRFEDTAFTDFPTGLDTGIHTLPEELDSRFLPGHVAIIMDGNSRWAESRGWPASIGHEMGVRSLREVIELSCRWGIRALTVFAFSSENWRRPQMEIAFLMNLFETVLRTELISLMKQDVCVSVMGDLSPLPTSLQRLIALACDSTRTNKGLKLTVALSYSGRQDIVEACKRLAGRVAAGSLQASAITELALEHELGTSWMGRLRDPDLLIRTSGEQRLSNFMLWQMAYTELYFTSLLWPDFREAEYLAALQSYQQRDRRFGARSKPPS